MTTNNPGRRRLRGDGDRGYVLGLTALFIVPLLLFTGFAVDLGAWTATASRAQAAADAASLAGVVYLPDQPNTAIAKALETARKNGYQNGVNGVTVTATPNARNELQVEIYDPNVEQYFSSVFVSNPTITRSGTAEFIRPVPMGSPESLAGQDPERGINPRHVLNIAGNATNKQNGDKRSAGRCGGSWAGCTPVNDGNGTNTDYSRDGYYFTIDVDETAVGSQPLSIEVYDPAYVYNDDGCGSNQMNATQINAVGVKTGDPYYLQRYASGRTPWCTGDQNLTGNSQSNGSNIVTTYIVRAPDDTPSDVTNNPAICAISFDPYGNPAQGSTAWIGSGGGTGIHDFLMSDTPRGREDVLFRDHYRQWFPVCQIPASALEAGQYILQIRTNADLSTPFYSTTAGLTSGAGSLENAASPLPNTGGHNRYNLRTGFGTDLTTSGDFDGVSLSALGHFPIYMNQLGSVAEFYLARITPETAGKTLQLTFWDMADISGGSATFDLLSPSDATTPLTGCDFSRDGQKPPPGVTVSGCQVSGITSANYNGRNVVVKIPIPGSYDCAVADPLGCWVKVRVTVVGAGATPSDTTTWSATMTGDPVRLIR
jgi:hypothetical protein